MGRGAEAAREKGLRAALETVLTTRFGALPVEIKAAITALGAETLEMWLRRACTVERLEEVGILPGA